MGTVSELQVGDDARVRVGLSYCFTRGLWWNKASTLSKWCGSEQTIFGLCLYHMIYVKFRG